jgi:ferredoxin
LRETGESVSGEQQMKDQAHIVYFSGTGGTALAAETMSASLRGKGAETRVSEIFHDKLPQARLDELLVLLFPVYAGDAPSPVAEWIASLGQAQRGKAAVIAVSGGGEVSPNTACRVKTIKRLEKRGFAVIGEYMLCMPSNLIVPTPEAIAVSLIRALPEQCGRIADEILAGTKNRKRPLRRDRVILPFLAAEKAGAKLFGKTLKADSSCIHCGLCAKNCPRGNIQMRDEKPAFGWRCALCLRCIYACPQHAIHTSMSLLKKAVFKDGFDLQALRIKAAAQDGASQEAQDAKADGLWEGVAAYLEQKSV